VEKEEEDKAEADASASSGPPERVGTADSVTYYLMKEL
jgi:hypothetical protein